MTAIPNKTNALQLIYTKPVPTYRGTKAAIEALTGLVGGEEAHATDTGENGYYDEVAAEWVWGGGGGGGGGGTWGSITGELQNQEDLAIVLNRVETKQVQDYAKTKKALVASKVFSNSNFI